MTTTADASGLLAGIVAKPADDGLRLIYADWLDDPGPQHDPARAEFIRVQVELARLDEMAFAGCPACECPDERGRHDDDCPRSPRHPRRRRERELLEAHWHPWSGVPGATYCANFGGSGALGVEFRRGFVSEARLTLAAFVGGECGCVRRVDEQHIATRTDCPACSGTGRTPGAAGILGASLPLERVVLTDREPALTRDRSNLYFWRQDERPEEPGSYLPHELFELVPVGHRYDWMGVRYHDTRDAALDALSAAAIRYAKAAAGRGSEG